MESEDLRSDAMADEGADEDALLAEDSEMATETAGGDGANAEDQEGAGESAEKTEDDLERELKETQISIPRYAPHTIPEWNLEAMRTRWQWHLRIFPIDQEDCRNCILDTASKISEETWYYAPKRKNGQGIAELSINSTSEAKSVMARVVRMPFYHRFVTIEINRRKKEESEAALADGLGPYREVEESAVIVFDATKCEKIKNTASSKGGQKRRTLWVRYLSEDTTPELLRVVFPFAQTAQVQTQEDLRIGEIRVNGKTDVLLFMKSYLTMTLNGTHILSLQNNEPTEGEESKIKAELDTTVTAIDQLETAPVTVADRLDLRKDDKGISNRVLKRSLQPQFRMVDGKRKDGRGRMGMSGEPPAKRGGRGSWGDRFDGRRQGGGGGRFSGGYPGGPGGMGGYGGGPGYGGPGMDPQGMAAEMIMMQAQLNQTIQNQLRMLHPGGGGRRGGGGGGGRNEGRRSGGGGGGWGGGRGGGGRKGFGGGGGGW